MMHKRIITISLFILFMGCQQKVHLKDINKLNGYWEIEKVILPDNTEKFYEINRTYDYIEIGKENKGFRKKVIPQSDHKFLSGLLSETIEVFTSNDKIYLKCTTYCTTWKEELKSISDKNIWLIDEDNKTYIYKRVKAD